MRLSIWHCEALYVLAQLSINQIASMSGIDPLDISGSVACDKWQSKRNKYEKLNEHQKYDESYINLIITEFDSDPAKRDFIHSLLEKMKSRSPGLNEVSKKRRDQYVAMLGEFGMDKDSASSLISNIERDASQSDDPHPESEYSNINTSITIEDSLDTINAGYRYLVNAHDASAIQIHNDLRKKINFFSSMLDDIESKMPQSLSFEELVSSQRNIRHAASAYASLVQLHYDIGGLKGYVNHHSAVAKLFGQGYMVIKRDEMGRLLESSDLS
jgi:hypothetical protein